MVGPISVSRRTRPIVVLTILFFAACGILDPITSTDCVGSWYPQFSMAGAKKFVQTEKDWSEVSPQLELREDGTFVATDYPVKTGHGAGD